MINKSNSNPNNRFIPTTRVNRNNSQVLTKKSEISSRLGTPRQNNDLSKIRRTSFWMKKVIGGYVNEQKTINQVLPNRSIKVLSMKVKTQTSEADDQVKQQNKNNLKDLNSKFSLLLKYQQQIMDQVRLIGQQKVVKQNYCQKIQSLLNKVFKMIQKSSLMQKLPSLNKIIDNQVQATNLLFTKTKQYVGNFIERAKSNDLIVKNLQLEKQNNKLMNKCHYLQQDIKKIRGSKIQILKEQDVQKINIHQIDFKKLYQVVCENNEPKVISIEATKRLCQKILQKSLIGIENTSMQTIYCESLKNLIQNDGLCGLKKLLQYPSLKNKTLSFNNEDQLRTQTLLQVMMVDIINGKLNYNLLMSSIKANKIMKQKLKIQTKRDLSLSQLLLLMNKFTIMNCAQKKAQIICSLISSIRQTNNDQHIQRQLIQSIKDWQIINPSQYDKQNAQKSNRISRMKNKRLINCMNLFQGKGKQSKIQKSNINIQENLQIRVKKFNKIYIKSIDCLLCVYFYIKQQFQWINKTILTNFIIYQKPINFGQFYSIMREKLKYQFYDQFSKNKVKIQSIINLFQILRKNRKNRLMQEDIKQNIVEQIVKSCQQNVLINLLHKIE